MKSLGLMFYRQRCSFLPVLGLVYCSQMRTERGNYRDVVTNCGTEVPVTWRRWGARPNCLSREKITPLSWISTRPFVDALEGVLGSVSVSEQPVRITLPRPTTRLSAVHCRRRTPQESVRDPAASRSSSRERPPLCTTWETEESSGISPLPNPLVHLCRISFHQRAHQQDRSLPR